MLRARDAFAAALQWELKLASATWHSTSQYPKNTSYILTFSAQCCTHAPSYHQRPSIPFDPEEMAVVVTCLKKSDYQLQVGVFCPHGISPNISRDDIKHPLYPPSEQHSTLNTLRVSPSHLTFSCTSPSPITSTSTSSLYNQSTKIPFDTTYVKPFPFGICSGVNALRARVK